MDRWSTYPARMTVAALRERASHVSASALARERRRLGIPEALPPAPVRCQGRVIAHSFWGRAWCSHLESIGDYASRLPRGRSYLASGAVLDLHIGAGVLLALVQGSSLYRVTIEVELLPPDAKAALFDRAVGAIDSLADLLRGRLPEDLLRAMTDPKRGILPTPRQLSMRCSCPDWATMCKHVAAALYGVGARLDASPELLFRLRGVDTDELLRRAAASSTSVRPLAPAKQLTGDLAALFDIDLVADAPPAPPRRVSREHLRVLGLSARTIDAWLREGVLVRTEARNLYERTAEADRRIEAFLAQ